MVKSSCAPCAVLGAFLSVLLAAGSAPALLVAFSSDDVCDSTDDPCVVSEEVEIVPGSTLDFGHRALRIEGSGSLDFGGAPSTVRCGRLDINVDDESVAIRASGTGGPDSPTEAWRIEVVRQCSASPRACLSGWDCDLGQCLVRQCEKDPSEFCYGDSGCNLGECENDGTCRRSRSRSCSTNSDCQVGPCGTQRFCHASVLFDESFRPAAGPLACTTNTDCQLGECSVGDGRAHLGGTTELSLVYPDHFIVRAASDVELAGPLSVVGREGQVSYVSGLGDLLLDAPVGTDGPRGAFLFFQAKSGDLHVRAPLRGDGSNAGAQIGLFAERDLHVEADVVARTVARRDRGGEVFLRSGRDLRVEGGTPDQPITIHGGFLVEHEVGEPDEDGGWVSIEGRGRTFVDEHTVIWTEGDSARLSVSGQDDLDFRGSIFGVTFGNSRTAPRVDLWSGNDVRVTQSSSIEVLGEEGARTGALSVAAARDLDFDATARLAGTGREQTESYLQPIIHLEGCVVEIGDAADVLNEAALSRNLIVARGALEIEGGASWICAGCSNVAKVRTSDNPIDVAGAIVPPLELHTSGKLEICANCVDPGSGERNVCDDGIACTQDFCSEGACHSIPDDSFCQDDRACYSDPVCSPTTGCQAGPAADCTQLDDSCYLGTCDRLSNSCVAAFAHGLACDDGDECTDLDTCTSFVCKGRRDIACGDCGNLTIDWGEDCDDGDNAFAFGDSCAADCQAIPCAYPTGSKGSRPTTTDALFVLRGSVGLASCAAEVCDVNGNGAVESSDALLVLRSAVGLPSLFACPVAQV